MKRLLLLFALAMWGGLQPMWGGLQPMWGGLQPAGHARAEARATSLDDLAWMAGHWSATVDGVEMEEVWLAPKNGVMVGMHRDARGEKASFEFMRIAATPEGITFLAQPGGRPVTAFPLVASSGQRVVFANPKHDFPQRIAYSLREGKLCATVEGEGQPAETWCWSRR